MWSLLLKIESRLGPLIHLTRRKNHGLEDWCSLSRVAAATNIPSGHACYSAIMFHLFLTRTRPNVFCFLFWQDDTAIQYSPDVSSYDMEINDLFLHSVRYLSNWETTMILYCGVRSHKSGPPTTGCLQAMPDPHMQPFVLSTLDINFEAVRRSFLMF